MIRLAGLAAISVLAAATSGMAAPVGNAVEGANLFGDQCGLCHLEEGGGQGPSLKGVVGRRAGSKAGVAYTPALKAYGRVWTPVLLDAFLANPGGVVPGTAMPINVSEPKTRADLVAYLATYR